MLDADYAKKEVSISKAAELAGLNIEEMKRVLLLFLFSKPIATCLFDDNLTIVRILPLSITDHALPITDYRFPITHHRSRITDYQKK